MNETAGEQLFEKLADAVEAKDAPAVATLSERVLAMTMEEKIAYSARLNLPWQKAMLGLLDAYIKEYPPATTRVDVLQAVSVVLPLRAFIALMSSAQVVIMSAGESEKKLIATAEGGTQ